MSEQIAEKVIEIEDLTKEYKGFPAVRGISFDVKKGEIFGILGPNGAGKTTTLEIIEGLKVQTAGKVTVLGLNNLKSTREIKKRIGVQLQASEYLNNLNLVELLNLFASLYDAKINALKILDKVDLENKAKSMVKELSGGQKQRFTIATALVHTPEIIFLDEPTTGLDPNARRSIWELIKDMNNDGITIVMTTHYMEEAEYLCDRVAVMDAGQILRCDSPEKLISELAGTYKLSFFVNKEVDWSGFKKLTGVIDVFNEYPKIIIELKSLDSAPKIIEQLGQTVRYSFLNLKSGTLEDVYLRLTGHEYEE